MTTPQADRWQHMDAMQCPDKAVAGEGMTHWYKCPGHPMGQLPQTKPSKEWLVNAIQVYFASTDPSLKDPPEIYFKESLADHLLYNWLTVEQSIVWELMGELRQYQANRDQGYYEEAEEYVKLDRAVEVALAHAQELIGKRGE